jgi:hypothetical protein
MNRQNWMVRGKDMAVYDEQTIEAGCMVEACRDAYFVTGEKKYLEFGKKAYQWFLGRNSALQCMVKADGAVYDAINGPKSVNENCGAESLISWGLALSCLDTF